MKTLNDIIKTCEECASISGHDLIDATNYLKEYYIKEYIYRQMTNCGLPNNLKWVRIDPDILEEIVENVNAQVHEHPCDVSTIVLIVGRD